MSPEANLVWRANHLIVHRVLSALQKKRLYFDCARLWSCVVIDSHSEVIMALDDCRSTKRPKLSTCTRKDVYLMMTQVVFKPFKMTLKCPAKMSLSTAGDSVCKCWKLFARYPACVLHNCRTDELSRFMEVNSSCWLWDRNNRCCLQAHSQKLGQFSLALLDTETDSLCFDSFSWINRPAWLMWLTG